MHTRLLLILTLIWTAFWWAAAWSHTPLLGRYSFFPLWLGFIATTNALAELRYGDSLMRRMRWQFVWLFIISMPMWWFFEYLNIFVQNWHYLLPPVSQLHFVIESSIDFSTVVPAVLSATFLVVRSRRPAPSPQKPFRVTQTGLFISIALGMLSFWALYAYPLYAFPLVWLAPLLVLDPLGYWLGLPSIFRYASEGRWRIPVSLMLATLGTGFFWEMWNYYSFPKWYYTVPWVGFWKIFEMPLLGYSGYLMFGLVVWSYSILALACINKKLPQTIIP